MPRLKHPRTSRAKLRNQSLFEASRFDPSSVINDVTENFRTTVLKSKNNHNNHINKLMRVDNHFFQNVFLTLRNTMNDSSMIKNWVCPVLR